VHFGLIMADLEDFFKEIAAAEQAAQSEAGGDSEAAHVVESSGVSEEVVNRKNKPASPILVAPPEAAAVKPDAEPSEAYDDVDITKLLPFGATAKLTPAFQPMRLMHNKTAFAAPRSVVSKPSAPASAGAGTLSRGSAAVIARAPVPAGTASISRAPQASAATGSSSIIGHGSAPGLSGGMVGSHPALTRPPLAADGTSSGAGGSVSAVSQPSATGADAPEDADASVGEKRKRPKHFVRTCAGEVWEDATLADWPEGDFRLFCGDLGNEVTDDILASTFRHFPSFARAKVVRDRKSHKSKGFGFVSFLDPKDALTALKELHGAYIGNRPVRLKRSTWNEKDIAEVKRKDAERDRGKKR